MVPPPSDCMARLKPLPYSPAMIPRRPSGFIEPCLPSKVARPLSGPLWVHVIKHDGYRRTTPTKRSMIAWRLSAFPWPAKEIPSKPLLREHQHKVLLLRE